MDSKDIINVKKNILKDIFPDFPGINKSKLLITNTGLYSVSKKEASLFLVNIIKKYFKTTNLTITDATGNVGSDTLTLAIHFNKVNSIEMDQEQFKVLKHNVKVYKLQNKINLFNDDSTIILNNLIQDVIYIDAPWTGPNYKLLKNMSLFMSEKELSNIYNEFKHLCKIMIFKVPKNYDFNYFILNVKNANISIKSFIKYNKISFYFIICK